MSIFLFLGRRSWALGIAALAASAASGAAAASLIVLINTALGQPALPDASLAWGFAGLVVARVLSATTAHMLLSHFAQRVLAGLSLDLSRRLLAVPLPSLEAIGMPRILLTLTDDVAVITWAIQSLPTLAINLAILGGCTVYLGWLSWSTFLGLAGVVALGTVTFLLLLRLARRHWQRAWQHRERLLGHFRSLIEGVKELKLHAPRREAFLAGPLTDTVEGIRRESLRGASRQALAGAWSQALFLGLVGILLFALPSLRDGHREALTGYLLVMIYMMSPIWSVIDTWPTIARGNLAIERLAELTSAVDARSVPVGTAQAAHRGWERLELKGVVFAYPAEDNGRPFQLGPLDFSLRPGEIVFVAGGNGSGKSTFAKVLTGLYPAAEGELRLDGQLVTEATREWYQAHISAIFSDVHLFDQLLGFGGPDLDGRARHHLARLELEDTVRVEHGVFSTTALSSGQRKRLALLSVLLDDRPIVLLDEWATDQDPLFREFFYTVLLPELKHQGRAVVVISHDDRFYGLGDRTVRLEDGQVRP